VTKQFVVMRDVTPAECDWLAETIPRGAAVWRIIRDTYGAIGPNGIGVTFDPDGDYPFFELPRDALVEAA
jgi:hypothetical protein